MGLMDRSPLNLGRAGFQRHARDFDPAALDGVLAQPVQEQHVVPVPARAQSIHDAQQLVGIVPLDGLVESAHVIAYSSSRSYIGWHSSATRSTAAGSSTARST